MESKLPSLTVSKKLVPMMSKFFLTCRFYERYTNIITIGNLIPRIIKEMDHAFDIEMPKCDGNC